MKKKNTQIQKSYCQCGCGTEVKTAIRTDARKGWIKGQPVRFVYRHAVNKTHGMSLTPEYRIYQAAKERCTNPKHIAFHRYGGRGIAFLFSSFEEFYKALGPRPKGRTLDRIDNDGPYSATNTRWSTPKQQAANRHQRKGQSSHLAKLDTQTVMQILSDAKHTPQTLLAKKHGVCNATISHIVTGRNWAHVAAQNTHERTNEQ